MGTAMIQNCIPLVRGLVDAFLFFESAGPNEVDPDSAVRCMEHMAASLLKLSRSDQMALRSVLEKFATDSRDPAYEHFVRELPDSIGLASSPSSG
jgi:hypothetical protein